MHIKEISSKRTLRLLLKMLTIGLITITSLEGAQPVFVDNFVNKIVDSDEIRNFWRTEKDTGFAIKERDNMIQFDVSGGGGAKYAAIRSTREANRFNFFTKRRVFYVKKMRKSGGAAGKFRFEITGNVAKYSSAPDAIWTEINGRNIDFFVKKNNSIVVNRSVVLEADCIMIILELDSNKYYLKSYCQVKRPSEQEKNQIRIRTMSGAHNLTSEQWGTSGNSYLGISAERTASSGTFHYDLAELRVVNFTDIANPTSVYDVFGKGRPPGVSASDPYYKKGILNVRRAPYNAVGDGTADDTAALQRAINDSYEYSLITYIPSGTYKISDKLMGIQKAIIRKTGSWDANNYDYTGGYRVMNGKSLQTFTIYGDSNNPPVIKLEDGAQGFGSTAGTFTPNVQREIFQIWSQPNGIQVNLRDALSEDPFESSTGLLYNITVRDIEIDIGRNHGAIGFQVSGAQSCNISNIKVTAPAGYGFACFRDLGGVGGSNIRLTGTGCKYGIYTTKRSVYPHITGLDLANQTSASVFHKYNAPLIITGAKIVKRRAPIMTLQNSGTAGGNISLIDAQVIFQDTSAGKAIVNTNNRNLHLHNVYIKNANQVTKNIASKPNGWTLVREYGFNGRNSEAILNGTKKTNQAEVYKNVVLNASAPTVNYLQKHLPAIGEIPGIKDIVGTNGTNGSAVSIKSATIVGDNNDSDWHAEIQEAINRFNKVYIPKGNYKISKPIELRANTKLIGLGAYWSSIGTHNNWSKPENTALLKAPSGTNPVISDFKLAYNQAKGVTAVLWNGGKKSLSRCIKVMDAGSGKPAKAVQLWRFTGNGGGRHYGNLVRSGGYGKHNAFRIIHVNGTTNPLAIYGINSETSKNPHHEILNAQNVYLFGIKNESGGLMLRAKNSSNVFIVGQGGNFKPAQTNDGIVQVENDCNNITVANICPLDKSGNGFTLKMGSTRINYPTKASMGKKGATPVIMEFGGSTGGGNASPVLSNINNRSVAENQTTSVAISAADADGDPITLGASGLPGFGSLADNGDGTGSLTFNPGYTHSGSYIITVTADDDQGGSDSESFTLTVNNVNRRPTLVDISDQTVNAGNSITVNITSSDPDGNPITLSAPGLPSFGTLTDNGNSTGNIRFTPTTSHVGSHTIQYRATDSLGGVRTKSFTLTVNAGNTAPILTDIANRNRDESTTTTVWISASDPDGDSITLSATGIPSFGTLTDNGDGTGNLRFTPSFNHSGTYTIQVKAEDDRGLSDTDSFNLIINNVNRAPSIAPIADQNMSEGSNLQIGVAASDPDSGDTLTLSVNNLPSFGSFSDNGDGTGSIDLSPAPGDECIHVIVVQVNDGNANNNTAEATFTLTVNSTVAYRNDFSSGLTTDDFNGDTDFFTISGGTIASNTPGVWKKINVRGTLFPETTENYRIVARMKSESVGAVYEGAALRFRDINADNYYELHLRSTPGYDVKINGKVDGVSETLGQWDLDINPNDWNTFTLEVSSNRVELYVGNTHIGGGNIGLSTGKVGLRQRANSVSWDYYRIIGTDEADYIEDFNDQSAQDWVFAATEFQTTDTGAGDFALAQISGENWNFATYNQVISVDQNYTVSVDGKATSTRTNRYDSPILVLKYIDNQNWIYLYVKQETSASSASALVLKKKIAGVNSEYDLPSSPEISDVNVNEWHNIRAQVNGSNLTVWVSSDSPISAGNIEPDLSNPVFNGSTKCGIRSCASGNLQFDNFAFFEEYAP